MKRLSAMVIFALWLTACTESAQQTATSSLDDFKGQWLLVNYWAQWCKPCIQEIPELNRINDEFSEVSVLGVNFDGITGDELATQIRALGVEFPILAQDPAAELGISRPQVLPTTLVLDPSGELVQTLIGPQTLSSLAAATGQSPADDTASEHE